MPVSNAIEMLLFRQYFKKIGRAYIGQSIALIDLCRYLVEKYLDSDDQDLQIILGLADDALHAAAEAGKNKTSEADSAFKTVHDRLERYLLPTSDRDCKKRLIALSSARLKDEASVATRAKLKEKVAPILEIIKKTRRKRINFVIPKSLHEHEGGLIIHQEIDNSATPREVLWNFSRYKDNRRITLKQNPHFYLRLPREASDFHREFHQDPLKDFGAGLEDNAQVYVLLDRSCRLHLELANPRTFGNMWHPHKAIILKDVCGILESADRVCRDIDKTLDFWYRPSAPGAFQPPVRSSDPCYSDDDRQIIETPFEDWRTLVHAAIRSRDMDLMIRAKESRSEPTQGWRLLPSPKGPPAEARKSRENSQKIRSRTRHGKSATPNVDHNISSLNVATSELPTPSTPSVNESFDRPESTLVDQDPATSQGHFDYTGDARSDPRASSDLQTLDPMERPETGPLTPVSDTPPMSPPPQGGVKGRILGTVSPLSPQGPIRRKGWFRRFAEDVLIQLGVEISSDDHGVPTIPSES